MTDKAARERDDRRLFRERNIFFRGPAYKWPIHHMITLSKIKRLGSMQFGDYSAGGRDANIWKHDMKAQVRHLVEVASRLADNQPTEMQWRLELETIIFQRFTREIECPEPTCKSRWWRSEIEVVPEAETQLSRSIRKRQLNRESCTCDAETRLQNRNGLGLNRIFENRADELVLYGGEIQVDLRRRKPDRVYGLAQTRHFDRSLKAASKAIQQRALGDSSEMGPINMVRSTPFEENSRPLMFPFLVSEAKSERGDSFDSCQRQTAFPIWDFLRIQEQLESQVGSKLAEQGGPFVWFFASRGEEWRLYGCYTDGDAYSAMNQVTETTYNIHCLWSGRVDTEDGALQLLLIVDYIFDWARDLYRAGILNHLKSLSRSTDPETVSISADSEIHSQVLVPPGIPQNISNWRAQVERFGSDIMQQHHASPHESLLEQWKSTDTVNGVFRHASDVQNRFFSLSLTKESTSALFSKLLLQGCSKTFLANYARMVLKTVNFIISNDLLHTLEEQWTGKTASFEENESPPGPRYAFITYSVHLNEEWQPQRVLSCVTIDGPARVELMVWATLTTGRVIFKKLPLIPSQGLLRGIQHLDETSMRETLAAAITCTSGALMAVNTEKGIRLGFLSVKACLLIEFDAQVWKLSQTEKVSSARWSRQSKRQDSCAIPQNHITSPLLRFCYSKNEVLKDLGFDSHVLVHNKDIQSLPGITKAQWCLFSLSEDINPPNIEIQYETILNFAEDLGFYIITSHIGSEVNIEGTAEFFDGISERSNTATQALLQWSEMLRLIGVMRTILSVISEKDSLTLSSCIKRSWQGPSRSDDDIGFFPKRARLDILDLNQEVKKEDCS